MSCSATHIDIDPASPPTDDVDTTLLADAEALNDAVSALVRIYQFRDRDKICCYDISVTQCYALEALVREGPQRSQTLSATLRLDKSTTTRVVDALVRKSYVERTPDPDDGRAVVLRVTAAGRDLYERINSGLIDQQAELLEDLDPTVRSATISVIRRLAARAEARFAQGQSVGSCAPACGVETGSGKGCGCA
jgi:MarR family transcriptional regulator, 2-MHQ and catechol-resistance regulon repressor